MKRKIFSFALLLFSYCILAQDTTKKELVLSARQSSAEVPSKEFKPSGKVWGAVFGDVFYKAHADSAKRGNKQYSTIEKDYNAFDLRRVYLGYDYQISEKFSAEFLLSHEGDFLSSGNRTVYVKAANLRWKNIFSHHDLIIGQQQTPTWSLVTEKIWGYRSVEKTVSDINRAGSSNDLGIGLQGRYREDNFGYNLLVGNGNAAKAETDRFKKIYAEVFVKFLQKKVILDVYFDYDRYDIKTPGRYKIRSVGKVVLAYQSDFFTAGLELYTQQHTNAVTPGPVYLKTNRDMMAIGYSAYARGLIMKDKLNYFARYDVVDPDKNYNSDYIYLGYTAYSTEMFVVAGLDYTPHKNVHIIPNVWYNSFSNRIKNASGLNKLDFDLVYRITFYYQYR